MNVSNLNIIEELERLAAAFPWDGVAIWIDRTPQGSYNFTGQVLASTKFDAPSIFTSGQTPGAAVDDAVRQASQRDPEIARNKAIRLLEEKIAKLKAVQIGLPPYKPGSILTNGSGEATIKAPDTIEV